MEGDIRLAVNDDKKIVIVLCEDHISTNGYVRVGWAIDELIKKTPFKFKGSGHRIAFTQSVVSLMESTGKYKATPSTLVDYDFDMARNPTFKPISLKEKYWYLIAIFTYVIGLLTPAFQELVKQKILKESPKSEQTIPIKTDTGHGLKRSLP